MSIHQKFHLYERVSNERLADVWSAVYEGYSENWDHEAVLDMAAVGEEVCSALEELFELRATLAHVEAALFSEEEGASSIVLDARAALKR